MKHPVRPGAMAREESIFNAAIELTGAAERNTCLDKACAGDTELRARIERLLAAANDPFFNPSPGPARIPISEHSFVSADTKIRRTELLADAPSGRIGRYKLLEKIGEGGCGVVYLAVQEEPVRRRVALKVIKLGMDTKSVIARFEAERQAVAMMDHPNIAKVLDAGATEAGRPFFVMELVRGVRITEYCDQANLSTGERLALFMQVCHAIQHAHQKGIIHRDIKPSNILVTLHDGVPVPKVIDFGIAKATTDQRLTDKTLFTALEQFIGTPAYMSPEQAEMSGLDIDTRSDIYSLGVLLYELLTGRTPFDSKDLLASGVDEMRRTICEKEPMRPSTRLSKIIASDARKLTSSRSKIAGERSPIDPDLDWIVMKCLEKDRTRRYETANGLAKDIERHLGNEPITACPPSQLYRFQKMVRRNKLAVTAASAMILTLIAGLSFSTWAFLTEAAQRRTAVEEQTKAVRAQEAEKQERLRADSEKIIAERHLYVANMNIAQQAWEQNNLVRLRQLLEETAESPDRGFEWYYWQRQSHLPLTTFRGHLQPVFCAAFSPDGHRLVTASEDQTAKVWEAASGRELLTLKGHSGPIGFVVFSPDGQRIVTASEDQTAKVWELASGRELLTLRGHSTRVNSVAFSPDGQRIVTGSGDQSAKVWEAASGREVLTLRGHSAPVNFAAFSPDGQRIVTASGDQTAKVWEAASGRELLTLNGHSAQIVSAVFSPDGRRIVTGSNDQTAKVWEAASGREQLTLNGHKDRVASVGFSPEGLRIVTGSFDQTAKVWEAASGHELLTLKGHGAIIFFASFSPDGQRIVTTSNDRSAKIWEPSSSRELLTLKGHSAAIRSVAFSSDGQRIVTGSFDQTAKMWKASSGRELLTLKGHRAPIRAVAFSPEGQRIVTGSFDQTAKIWEVSSGRELLTLKGHRAPIASVAFSSDGQRIVTGSNDQTAKVWDAASGRELLTLEGHSARIASVAFSSDGQRIVTGSADQTAKVWEASSGRELLALKGHSGLIWSVAYSPDGQRIVTGSRDRTAKVWEASSGRELLILKGHSAPIFAVTFSPDGQRIVTGSEDQTAKVWETSNGRELLTLKGHSAPILTVAFSPRGQGIVTGSEDQTAKVWQAAGAEQVVAWREEEKLPARLAAVQLDRIDEQQRQRISRARDEGRIKKWLILAPIAFAPGQSGAQAMDEEQIQGEGRLEPKAGEGIVIGSDELKWQELIQADHAIEFNVILEHVTPRSVAYAVCYIRSETEQRGLQMLVGSDDGAKVYLNGKQIHRSPFQRSFVADQDLAPNITLNAGLNVLVFKVVNESFDWQGSIRFTDTEGNPVNGIKVTLAP